MRELSTAEARVVGRRRGLVAATGLLTVLAAGAAAAQAQLTGAEQTATPNGASVAEIVVTANKRAETASSVPMSITAETGETLRRQGIEDVRDLEKITPGFIYADSYVGSPIFSIRGVGFSDISLGGRSTVTIYSDEAPIPFAIETRGADLDLERVEVLKGPQGTLFGQNSTGGAINYIAAKPTRDPEAGLEASYGNYRSLFLEGYVSGPIAPDLEGRIAYEHTQNGDWQKSYTTGAGNGRGEFNSGRISLSWTPGDTFKALLTVSGWLDNSDTQAGQLLAITPSNEASAPLVPGLLTYPLAPANSTAADFNPGVNYGKNNSFVQGTLRTDTRLASWLTLTSLSSISHYAEHQLQDVDGTSLSNLSELTYGKINSVFQEFRLTGEFARTHVVLGADYAYDEVYQYDHTNFAQSTTALTFVPLGLPLFADFADYEHQIENTYAVFGNVDYRVSDRFKVFGGVRFTQADDRFDGCSADSGDGLGATDFGVFQNFVRGELGLPANPPIQNGGCITANALYVPGVVTNKLNENNVSWRVGAEWTPRDRLLFYANASRGYKAGGFPSLGATTALQYNPATQEELTAYEVGFKSTLLDRSLQLTGAAFYYDYRDKQILGRILDPLFGPLLKLVNVPKSKIEGAEFQADWRPVRGLQVNAGVEYIYSEVLDHFTNYDSNGAIVDFQGEAFPNTPRWQVTSDVSYTHPLGSNLNGFAGVNVSYRSRAYSELGQTALLEVDPYTLVDLRAGIEDPTGRWRLWAWGRNVGNVYYWTAASRDTDTTTRFAGRPAMFGVTLQYRYR